MCSVPLMTSGCSPSVRHSHNDALKSLKSASPVLATDHTTLYCLPDSCDPSRVIREIETTAAAVTQWLGPNHQLPNIHVAILHSDDPLAQGWRANTQYNHGYTGRMYYQDNLLLVIGDPAHDRFWSVLRHEVSHATVHSLIGHHTIAFWFDEGVATLFEMGVDQAVMPKPNLERRALCQYFIQTRHALGLRRVIYTDSLPMATGNSYARAWASVAYLYHQDVDLKSYVQAVQQGVPNKTAFNDHVLGQGVSLAALENNVISWLR